MPLVGGVHLSTRAGATSYIAANCSKALANHAMKLVSLIGKPLGPSGLCLTGYTRKDGVGICISRPGCDLDAKPKTVAVAKSSGIDLYGMHPKLPDAANGYGRLKTSAIGSLAHNELDAWICEAATNRAKKEGVAIHWS